MNSSRKRSTRDLARAGAVAVLAYLFLGMALLTVLQLARPSDFDAQGHLLDGAACLFGLAVQAMTCFAAGAAAMASARGGVRATMLAATLALFAFNAASSAAFWSNAPAWYDWATLALTAPFVALGVAWRGARGRRRRAAKAPPSQPD